MQDQDTRRLVAEQLRADMANPIIAASPVLAYLLNTEHIEVQS